MSNFETLFGLKENQLKSTCILTPFLTKGMLESFNVNEIIKGSPYSCANSDTFTLIKTNVGAPFVGDAVLNLKDTYCSNIILFVLVGLVFGYFIAPSLFGCTYFLGWIILSC